MCCTDFAAILFNFFFKRRSGEIDGGEANDDAAAHDEMARGASSSHTSTEGQEIVSSSGYDYEVFLSFRGPDTRSGFTNFLYTSLRHAGIRTFKDDEDLRVGEEFAPELLQAINQSKISIPIFSKNYASSIWCLKEAAQMVENRKTGKQKIMPIFYDVAPSEVRHQIGYYEEAFRSHKNKRRYGEETISQWKAALSAVGAINGWDLHSEKNRQEGLFAKTVTQKVFNELKKAYLEVSDCFVSVDHQVDKIMEMIDAPTSETRIIGIYGMGGIGKTTIAKIIYNKLSHDFENCCFLPDIKETSKVKGNGIQYLQNQLICDILKTESLYIKDIYEGTRIIKDRLSNKRVLIFLDDVGEENHMRALIGKRDWFGKGSKLIITTRKKDVLNVPEVDCIHEVNGMDDHQSLQLFSKHAFRRDYPSNEHIHQSKRAIQIAGGLPLALEVIGSLLSCIEKKKWDAKLEKLEDIPPMDVQSKLRISYDALEVQEKHIFLDIACLLIGHDKDIMVYFWDFKFHPKDAMDVLENMSLIKIIEDNKVWMHDQLRDLGRQIVRQESNMEITKQSRVWNPGEALDLLRHEGRKKVKALRLSFDHDGQYRFTYEGFMGLSNLRFLAIEGRKTNFHAEEGLLWHKSPSNVSYLLPQLRWLSWRDIPLNFKITNFSTKNVVILDLSWSEIRDDWEGWSHMKGMKNLKVLDLSNCFHLTRTPNFSTIANLERLILYRCVSIVEVDGSICHLNHLVSFEARHCLNLRRLPDELGGYLASLEYLSLENCRSLEKLPNTIGNLESLVELNISGTSIKELPDSIEKLKSLKIVRMSENNLSKIPDAFWMIEKLEEIDAHKNNDIKRFHVRIDNCIYRNQSLRILKLKSADIYEVPRLPESLIELKLWELIVDIFPDLSNLHNLKVLDLSFTPPNDDVKSHGLLEDPIPRWIGNLTKLESLALRSPYVTTLPTDLSFPPQLRALHLRCQNMRRLPRLPSSLSSLCLQFCESLRSMEDLSNLKKLSSLEIRHGAMSEILGLGCLENLRDLKLWTLGQVETLPDLSKLNKLRRLRVSFCDNLIEIQGELPESLEELRVSSCESLQKLPDLSSLNRLQMVRTSHCAKLNVEAISRLCLEKSIKFFR